MKLDESIELINKEKNINEMNNLTKLSVSEMRNCMHEMMADENKSGCLYEVLTQEGFLPETLAEGEDYGTHCETMMEDDMVAEEMYKACGSNMSECGYRMQEFMNEYNKGVMHSMQQQYGKEKGKNVYYATANKQGLDPETFEKNEGVDEGWMEEGEGINPAIYKQLKHCVEHGHSYDEAKKHVAQEVPGWNLSMEDWNEAKEKFGKGKRDGVELEEGEEGGSRYMFFSNLELIKHHVEGMLAMDQSKLESILENGHDWAADHIATAKESIDQVFDFLTNEAEEGTGEVMPTVAVMGTEEPMMENEDEDEDDTESPTYLLNKKRVLDQEIAKFSKYVYKFIPMVDKLDQATMNQYFDVELRNAGEYSNEAFKKFLTKEEEESSVEYYERLTNLGSGYADIFSGLVEPRKRGYFAKYGSKIGYDVLDDMEDVLSDIFDMKNEIYKKKAEIEKIESSIEDRNAEKELDKDFDNDIPSFSAYKSDKKVSDILKADELGVYDDEEEPLEEANLPNFKPIIGKNVQSTNKSDSEESEKTELEDVEDSQETTEEKVDNLKNQKFAGNSNMESEYEKEIREKKQLGAFNALNLDFQNEVPQSYKDRVELEVTTGHSRKRDEAKYGEEANVDHEATKKTGEKMIAASKANQGERDDFYKANPITVTDDPYKHTSITGKDKGGKKNPGGGDLNESELADIERMKSMFGYEKKIVAENKKTNELNENEILFKNISTKKFI